MPEPHVFIIRARQEPREIPGAPPERRFWIEHQPGGEQRHFKDFIGVVDFIQHYLPDLMGESGHDPLFGGSGNGTADLAAPDPPGLRRDHADRGTGETPDS
jgi:hypothetical protein